MQIILTFLKGMVIGVANIIPGVSGGTMAFIMGIYHRLTESIGGFISNKRKRREYAKFILVIFLGAVFGILIFAKLFTWLLSSPNTTQHTYFFIVGLIIGSIPFILKLHKDMKPKLTRILLLLFSLAVVVSLSMITSNDSFTRHPEIKRTLFGILNITGLDLKHNLWLTVCGFLTAAAMVLPGVSGSALLVSLGEYTNILYVIDKRLVIPAAFFGLGVVPGIIVSAKIMSILLKRYASGTYYFILGLMLASIFQIYKTMDGSFISSLPVFSVSIILLILGFATSYIFSRIQTE